MRGQQVTETCQECAGAGHFCNWHNCEQRSHNNYEGEPIECDNCKGTGQVTLDEEEE